MSMLSQDMTDQLMPNIITKQLFLLRDILFIDHLDFVYSMSVTGALVQLSLQLEILLVISHRI